MEGANRWLQDNPGLAVWKCESVESLLNVAADGTITYDLNEMIRHDSTFGFSVYIKGIRLERKAFKICPHVHSILKTRSSQKLKIHWI